MYCFFTRSLLDQAELLQEYAFLLPEILYEVVQAKSVPDTKLSGMAGDSNESRQQGL